MGRVLPGYLSKWTTENVAKGKIHTTNIKKLFPVVLKYPVRLVWYFEVISSWKVNLYGVKTIHHLIC
jgi:hypothetical protein